MTVQVRAKFYVTAINHRHQSDPTAVNVEIVFAAVYGNGEANKDWSKWTPAGEIKMTVTNPSAVDRFEVGKEYFVDFTPA